MLKSQPIPALRVRTRAVELGVALVLLLGCAPRLTAQTLPGVLRLQAGVDNTWGGVASPGAVELQASGPSSLFGFGAVSGIVPSGFYSLSASISYTGYAASSWSCGFGSNLVFVAPGSSVTCQIVFSSIPAKLTLFDTVDNTNGGNAGPGNWTLTAIGPSIVSGAGGFSGVSVKAGVYTLLEVPTSAPPGYSSGGWSCGSELNLNLGDVVSCHIVNSSLPATLTLVDTVDNTNGGNAPPTAWTLRAAGTSVISGATGSSNVTNVPVKWGTYTLSEPGGPSGYSSSAWSCTGGSLNGNSLALANAAVATCSIVNSSMPATLTLYTLVDNTNGGNAVPGDWTLSASGQGIGISGQSGTPAVTNATVKATTYLLAESGGPSGYSASPWSCDTAAVAGNQVTLAPGQTAACAIRNAYNAASATSPVFLGPSGTARNPTASIAEPINTATGNYYSTHADLYVKGRGLSFSFNRQYNSLVIFGGPLGFGWTHSYNVFLSIDAQTGVVTLKDVDGSAISFTPSGGGGYTQGTGIYDHLRQNADNSFTLTRKNQTRLSFSPAGRLTAVSDRIGNAQVLGYDTSGNLISVTDSTGRVFHLVYNLSNQLTSVTDPIGRTVQYTYDANSNLTSYRDVLGGLTQYAYDGNHRLLSATDPRGIVYLQNTYDGSGRVVSQKNGRGFATTLAYDTPAVRTTTVNDALGNATKYVYDSNYRLLQMVNAQGGMKSYVYDANNNKIAISDENGQTTHLVYDLNGNVISMTDALGNASAFTYDASNNMLTSTSPGGATTIFLYDASGNLISSQDALGDKTTSAYDAFGEMITRTDAAGNVTAMAYDANGDLAKVTDGLGNAIAFGYDAISRVISTTDGNGHKSTISYDSLGKRTAVVDALGHRTQYSYDAVGNELSVTDANGNSTACQYDGVNNLVSVTDPLGNKTTYAYDANNNRVSFANAKGNTTTYIFDSLNRRLKITDPLGIVESFVYDLVGNLVSMTDGNGKPRSVSFDSLKRPVKRTYFDGTVITYSYDVNGNRSSMTDSHGVTTYGYDAMNRIVLITSPGGNVVKYSYDGLGRRKAITYPSGRIVTYHYDASGRLSDVTDWLARKTTYKYDAAGNRIAVTMGNGALSSFSYDDANRLLSITNLSGAKTVTSFAYTLDAVGNRTRVTDVAGGITQYGYEALNRLTSWVAPSGQITSYSYDGVGNRVSMTSAAGTTAYSYDAADHMLKAGTAVFSYDGNGSSLTKTIGATTVSYTFDAQNRLSSVSGGISAQYQYDGDGNRISQQVGASNYQYALDLARLSPVVLSESGPDGNIDFQYGRTLLSGSSATLEQFYQADGIGSTADVTDSTGTLKASYAYDPWGRLLNPIDPLGTKDKFKFAGEALDPQTGLYYLRARYYDPTVGRFISKDPLAGTVDVPMSRNRYAYALSNPLRYTDTLGLAADQNAGDQNLGSWWYTENPQYSIPINTSLYFAGLANPIFGYIGGTYSSLKDIATDSWGSLFIDTSGLLLTAAGADVAAGVLGAGALLYEVGSYVGQQFGVAYGDYMSTTVGDDVYYDLVSGQIY